MSEHRKPKWAQKVPAHKIKKLYELDAMGIYDIDLADDVGLEILSRVDSILMVTSSNLQKAICIECRTIIPHNFDREFILCCPNCGWSMQFGEFSDTYKRQTLNGYGNQNELKEYLDKYPLTKSYREKMLLIDWLIHTFHGNLSLNPSRPTATNIIAGSNAEVANLIFSLAYGDGSVAAAKELEIWLEKFSRSIHKYIDPVTGTIKSRDNESPAKSDN